MKVGRNYAIIASIFCSILLLIAMLVPLKCSATMVWSDNFDDGNYDGWTVTGINMTAVPPVLVDGNYSAEDGLLRATGEGEGWIWNLASHPSTVATGTWSFDIDSPPTEAGLTHFYVFFMSDDTNFEDGIPDGYAFKVEMVLYQGFRGFELEKYVDGDNTQIAQYQTGQDVLGGYHIDITRDSTGLFNVWVNGTHRMSAQDDTHSTSDYFRFSTPAGPALDNIEVFDSIEFDPPTTDTTTTTETGEEFPLVWIVIGISIPVALIIIVVIIKKFR